MIDYVPLCGPRFEHVVFEVYYGTGRGLNAECIVVPLCGSSPWPIFKMAFTNEPVHRFGLPTCERCLNRLHDGEDE